jgi:DNA-3-methyladenine glycosylase I
MGWEHSLITHEDGLHRCGWCGTAPDYIASHDTEWGVPEFDSRALFEKLLLDGFQAGLSWITILRKRDSYREAFDGFDAEKMARYSAEKKAELMLNPGIIRNRLKIDAAVTNAQAYLDMSGDETFSDYLWGYMDGRPMVNRFTHLDQVPAATPLAEAISKDLKKRGFRFVGPTIVYAFMQAVGMVNDHLVDCHRHGAVSGERT